MGIVGLLAVAVVVAVALIYTYSVVLEGQGNIVTETPGLRIFGDEALTKEISGIQWGNITAGGQSTVTLWIKNNGTVPFHLTIDVSNWNPSAAPLFLAVSWSDSGLILQPNEARAVDLILAVDPAVTGIGAFSNRITINGKS